MKVLITGATGYIGGRLLQHLSDNSSHELYAISRNVPKEMIEMLPDVHFYNLDLVNPSSNLIDLCKKVDCIIHLAAANELQSEDDQVFACDINITASVRLLDLAIKNAVKRFIYISTAHVYGSPLVGTLTEKTPCLSRHPYAITHKAVEDFVLASHERRKIEGLVLRLSNSFGAPLIPSVDRWTLLLNSIARGAVFERKVELKSSAEQYRDFISLTSVCSAIEFFIEIHSEKLLDGLFNLGGNNSMRIKEMVSIFMQRCENVLKYKPILTMPFSTSSYDRDYLIYSVDKIKKIGFEVDSYLNSELDKLILFCCEMYKESINEIL